MRILGIDPGLATVGIGLVEAASAYEIHAKEWLVIKTKPGALPHRLAEIHREFSDYLRETQPELAVVEKLFFAKNETSGLDVAHARGCILLALQEFGIPVLEATPLQLKSCITGDGRATKNQVQDMLVRMLRLTTIPEPDDAADALALGVYGALRQDILLPTITAA